MLEKEILDTLRIALHDLKDVAEACMSNSGPICTNRKSRKAHGVHYPTKIYAVTQQLLAAQYFQGKIEQDFSLDEIVVRTADSLVQLLGDIEERQQWRIDARIALQDPDSYPQVVLWSSALTLLHEAIEHCRIKQQQACHGLTDFQQQTFNKFMKQNVWPRLTSICTDLDTVHRALLPYTDNACRLCKRYHDTKLCFLDNPDNAPLYSLQVKLLDNTLWQALRVELSKADIFQGLNQTALSKLHCLNTVLRTSHDTISIFSRDHSTDIYVTRVNTQHSKVQHVEMVSLRRWIKDGLPRPFLEVQRKSRIMLALIIAYYYLHFSGSSLWPDNNCVPDVWIEHNTNSDPIIFRPFLSLRRDNANIKSHRSEETFNNRNRPSLPALGKLLLEIWLGHSLSWAEAQDLESRVAFQTDNFNAWFYAIASRCWNAKTIREGGLLSHNKIMEQEFVNWVIKGLQSIADGYGIQQEHMFSQAEVYAPEILGLTSKSHTTFDNTLYNISTLDDFEFIDINDYEDEYAATRLNEPANTATNDSLCLYDDGTEAPLDIREKEAAEAWFEDFKTMVHPMIADLRSRCKSSDVPRVKVAILDTGAFFNEIIRSNSGAQRIKEYRSWCSTNERNGDLLLQGEDSNGHGTQNATVLLDVASQCQLYVGKIFEGYQQNGTYSEASNIIQTRIVNAIDFAVKNWKVDIISMSFGYDKPVEIIEDALERAATSGVLLFAAASNYGGLRAITFPASDSNVFCIHAMSGRGLKLEITTTPGVKSDFATVGSTIRTWSIHKQRNVERYCSGSSIATAVAAGIAATVIELLRCAKKDYLAKCDKNQYSRARERYESALKALKRKNGMQAVLDLIVARTDQGTKYSFLAPARFLCRNGAGHDTTLIDNILEATERRGSYKR